MRILAGCLLLCLMLISSGCNSVDGKAADGEGYIFEKKDGRVLILDNVSEVELGKKWKDIYSTYQGNAIWLKTSKFGLKVGQYVRYWIKGGIDDSFPAQAKALKIEVVK